MIFHLQSRPISLQADGGTRRLVTIERGKACGEAAAEDQREQMPRRHQASTLNSCRAIILRQ
jgi:hypothetical protein